MLSTKFVASAALLALGVQATANGVGHTVRAGSVAKCDVSAVSKSSSLSVSVAAKAVEKVDAVLCGPEEEVVAEASSSAHSIASAFAETIAEVTVDCYAKGHASFQVRGKSVASAQATALAQAYAAAYATADTCHKCSAASEILVESYEEIFLNATSEIHLELEGVANGTEVSSASAAFTRSFVNKTVTAFAESIIDARAASDSCEISATAEVETGDVEDSNTATCKVGVVAAGDEKISNGGVAIATSVSAKACGKGFAATTFEVEAEALGKVMSIAIAEISADCLVKGKGSACVLGKADITKTAEAVATAFASGFASAANKCGKLCEANTTVVSDAIGFVLATATSEVYDRKCGGPDSHFDINAVDKEIVEATTAALASILTNVTVTTDGECNIQVEVQTSVTPTPQEAVSSHSPHDRPLHGPSVPDHSTTPSPSPVAASKTKQGSPIHPPSVHPSSPRQPPTHPKATSPSAENSIIKSTSPHKPIESSQTRPPIKPVKKYQRKHGSVTRSQSASHRHQRRAKKPKNVQPNRVAANKGRHHNRLVRKPKKMLKYLRARDQRRGHDTTMKVRPLIHRIRAAQKVLAKRKAERRKAEQRLSAPKSQRHRRPTKARRGHTQASDRRRPRRTRHSRHPRQSQRKRSRKPRHV